MKRLIILIIPILILCGCQRKCVKSHEEEVERRRCKVIPVGKGSVPYCRYITEKITVCDEYED